MRVISFIFIVVYSRSSREILVMKLNTSFPSRGSYLLVHFVIRAMSWCWCYVWSGCISAVDEGSYSTSSGRRYNIYDQTWDLSTPSLIRSLSYDPCLRITNLLSIFEQRAKLSSDMLRSLLPFHCSSRGSLTCEHMVSNWCVIAFWTETVRKRSPQTVVFVRKCSNNFRLHCPTVASSWISRRAEQ